MSKMDVFEEEAEEEQDELSKTDEIDVSEADYESYLKSENKKIKKSDVVDVDENELIKRAQADDQMAWELIFKKYERFIKYMQHRMAPRIFGVVTPEDLESYTYEGLVRSVRQFDESKGSKFITFAMTVTKNWIMRLNLRNSRNYYQDDVLVRAEMMPNEVMSIDDKQNDNAKGEGRLLAEVIPDESGKFAKEEEEAELLATKLLKFVKNEIAKDYFLSSAKEDGVTYVAIAEKYGITRSRVDQLVKKERKNISEAIANAKAVYDLINIHNKTIDFITDFMKISEKEVMHYLKLYNYLYNHGKEVSLDLEEKMVYDENTFFKYAPFVTSPTALAYLEFCNRFGYVSPSDFFAGSGDSVLLGNVTTEIDEAKSSFKKLLKKATDVYTYFEKTQNIKSTAERFDVDGSEILHLCKVYNYFYNEGELPIPRAQAYKRVKAKLALAVLTQEELDSIEDIQKIIGDESEVSENTSQTESAIQEKLQTIYDDLFLIKAYNIGVDITLDQLMRAEGLAEYNKKYTKLFNHLFCGGDYKSLSTKKSKNAQDDINIYERIERLFPYNLPICAYCEKQGGDLTKETELTKLCSRNDYKNKLLLNAENQLKDFIRKIKKVGKQVASGVEIEQIAESMGEKPSFVKFYNEVYEYIYNDGIIPRENPLEIERLVTTLDELEDFKSSFDIYRARAVNLEHPETIAKRMEVSPLTAWGYVARQKQSMVRILDIVNNIAQEVASGEKRLGTVVKYNITKAQYTLYKSAISSLLFGEMPQIPNKKVEIDNEIINEINSNDGFMIYRLRRFEKMRLRDIATKLGIGIADVKSGLIKQEVVVAEYRKTKELGVPYNVENVLAEGRVTKRYNWSAKLELKLDEKALIQMATQSFPRDKGLAMFKKVKVDGMSIERVAEENLITIEELKQVLENASKFTQGIFTRVKALDKAHANNEDELKLFNNNKKEHEFYSRILKSLKLGNYHVPAKKPVEISAYVNLLMGEGFVDFEDGLKFLARHYILGEDVKRIVKGMSVDYAQAYRRKSEAELRNALDELEALYNDLSSGKSIEDIARNRRMTIDELQARKRLADRVFFLKSEDLNFSNIQKITEMVDSKKEEDERRKIVLKRYKPLLVTEKLGEVYDLIVQNMIDDVPLKQFALGKYATKGHLQGSKRAILEAVGKDMELADRCHNAVLENNGETILGASNELGICVDEVLAYAKLYEYFYSNAELPQRFNRLEMAKNGIKRKVGQGRTVSSTATNLEGTVDASADLQPNEGKSWGRYTRSSDIDINQLIN